MIFNDNNIIFDIADITKLCRIYRFLNISNLASMLYRLYDVMMSNMMLLSFDKLMNSFHEHRLDS